MKSQYDRRDFLTASAAAASSIVVPSSLIAAPVHSPLIPVPKSIEPIVRLIEETPRDRIIPLLSEMLKKKQTSYRDLIAGIYLMSIRNNTGSHHVFMMHGVHEMASKLPAEKRMLPVWWALDCVKSRQDLESVMRPIDPSKLDFAGKEEDAFDDAMQRGDRKFADLSITAIGRNKNPKAAFEKLWRWCSTEDAHGVIGIVNNYRLVSTIGWEYAEPALRHAIACSVGYGADAGLREANWARSKEHSKLSRAWDAGKSDRNAVAELLAQLRESKIEDVCRSVYDRLKSGEMNSAIAWDAIFLFTAEQMISYAIGGHSGRPLHTVTMANAMHFVFRTTRQNEIKLYLLLEALHRTSDEKHVVESRSLFRDIKIDGLTPGNTSKAGSEILKDVVVALPPLRYGHYFRDKALQDKAMSLMLTYGKTEADHREFFETARHYISRKASLNAHDVKFPEAIFENYQHTSLEWRPYILAASVFFLHGPNTEDNPVVQQLES